MKQKQIEVDELQTKIKLMGDAEGVLKDMKKINDDKTAQLRVANSRIDELMK